MGTGWGGLLASWSRCFGELCTQPSIAHTRVVIGIMVVSDKMEDNVIFTAYFAYSRRTNLPQKRCVVDRTGLVVLLGRSVTHQRSFWTGLFAVLLHRLRGCSLGPERWSFCSLD